MGGGGERERSPAAHGRSEGSAAGEQAAHRSERQKVRGGGGGETEAEPSRRGDQPANPTTPLVVAAAVSAPPPPSLALPRHGRDEGEARESGTKPERGEGGEP